MSTGMHPTPSPSIVFTFRLNLSPSRNLGVHHIPIWGGVKGKVVDKNFSGFIMLVVVEISIGSIFSPIVSMLPLTNSMVITLVGTTKILIDISIIFKLIPPLSGLVGSVITCSFCSETKMCEVALVVLILVPIFT
jgi:hypothetical protein